MLTQVLFLYPNVFLYTITVRKKIQIKIYMCMNKFAYFQHFLKIYCPENIRRKMVRLINMQRMNKRKKSTCTMQCVMFIRVSEMDLL